MTGAPDPARQRILLIGEGPLSDVAARTLGEAGALVQQLSDPSDREIREAIAAGVDAVMAISRDDRVSLRLALVIEALAPGIRLIVTIYNRDLGAELRRAVPNVRVMSMGDIAAPSLAAACLDDELLSVRIEGHGRLVGIRSAADGSGPAAAPLALHRANLGERVVRNASSLLHPFELSAKTLLAGLSGFALILIADSLAVGLALHESAIDSIYSATKTIVTVGSNAKLDNGPAWLKLYSAAMMLAALAFTGVFIAGLIERLLDRRLVAILGPGQVGLRLCMMLHTLGVPVVAVEVDPQIDNVRRARQYNVPVVIGRGSSRAVLRRVSLERARAIAAVTSDEIENIAAAVAALAIKGNLRTVLRAGSGDVLDETRALFRIGAVRDVYWIGGTLLAAAALGSSADEAFSADDAIWVIANDGAIERADRHLGADPAALEQP